MTSFTCNVNVSRASQAVNWRVRAPVDDATDQTSNAPRAPRRSAQQPRAGQFWFLPPHDRIPDDSRVKELESHRPTYGHPIIVKAIVGEFAEFCTVTSFQETPLSEKASSILLEDRRQYRFIQNSQRREDDARWEHPDGYASLQLCSGSSLQKPSYAVLDKHLCIEHRYLTEYMHSSVSLTPESLDIIINHKRPNKSRFSGTSDAWSYSSPSPPQSLRSTTSTASSVSSASSLDSNVGTPVRALNQPWRSKTAASAGPPNIDGAKVASQRAAAIYKPGLHDAGSWHRTSGGAVIAARRAATRCTT